jgi:beta-barrel assembly-enhancing protease
MKNTKTALTIIFVAALLVLIFSCESLGSIAQVGAALGQAFGVIDDRTADAISKSGVAISKAFEDITPEQEYYIGRAVGANILSNYKIQTNKPDMLAYVNKICNALVINSPRPEIFNGYHVNILDSDEINAFATSGGHIFITRGLIESTTSEDTLAAVIAHEVSHIQLQHGLKAIKNSRITQALLVTGTSAAGAAGNKNISELVDIFGDSINEVVTTMVTNGYSRTQEYEADSMAMSLMDLAGYEPSSLVDMLKTLEKTQSSHPGGFNKTHPSPTDRIANAQKTVGNYNVPDTRSFRTSRYAAVR